MAISFFGPKKKDKQRKDIRLVDEFELTLQHKVRVEVCSVSIVSLCIRHSRVLEMRRAKWIALPAQRGCLSTYAVRRDLPVVAEAIPFTYITH